MSGWLVLMGASALMGSGGEGKPRAGLQPGEMLPGAFHPLNVNGEYAGKPYCLVCDNGLSPVVMIFARRVSEPVVKLLDAVEAAAVKESELGCFVVFLSKEEGLEKELGELAKTKKYKHMILSIDEPAGPEGYNLDKEAEVTVVLYREHVVKANHAAKKGEWNDKATQKALGEVPKILPPKKGR